MSSLVIYFDPWYLFTYSVVVDILVYMFKRTLNSMMWTWVLTFSEKRVKILSPLLTTAVTNSKSRIHSSNATLKEKNHTDALEWLLNKRIFIYLWYSKPHCVDTHQRANWVYSCRKSRFPFLIFLFLDFESSNFKICHAPALVER